MFFLVLTLTNSGLPILGNTQVVYSNSTSTSGIYANRKE